MSKTIDTLDNVSSKKHANLHHMEAQDELARTYFHAPSKPPRHKKSKWKLVLPWLVAACAVIITIAIVLLRSSIDIKVRVLGEIPSMPIGLNAYHAGSSLDKGLFLVELGEPNKDIIKNAYFAGDAKNFSIAKQEELALCNSRGAGWANYTIELKEPVDLNKLDVVYTAKGVRGDEFLAISIADSGNRIYRLEKDLSSSVGVDWQRYTVNFRRVKNALDLSNIVKIKFEFGSLTAGNYPSAVLFLRDIYIAKTRRLKWL